MVVTFVGQLAILHGIFLILSSFSSKVLLSEFLN
jgi:uncharacterized membrane protein HdeD (DUF308 family)